MRRHQSPPREAELSKLAEPLARRVLLPPGEGGPKGRMRALFALTRRFAAPSPEGRGTSPSLVLECTNHLHFTLVVDYGRSVVRNLDSSLLAGGDRNALNCCYSRGRPSAELPS